MVTPSPPLHHTSVSACRGASRWDGELRAALVTASPERRGAGRRPSRAGTRPGSLSCPFTVTLQNGGAGAVTKTMAGPGGSRGARLGWALLGVDRRAQPARREAGRGQLPAMAEAEDGSIHTKHIGAVHNVPMDVLIRPIPSELDAGKVQSLMQTLQVSTALMPPGVLEGNTALAPTPGTLTPNCATLTPTYVNLAPVLITPKPTVAPQHPPVATQHPPFSPREPPVPPWHTVPSSQHSLVPPRHPRGSSQH